MESPKVETQQSGKTVWNFYPRATYKAEEISLDFTHATGGWRGGDIRRMGDDFVRFVSQGFF